jgi:uncharacterized Zn-binding protein involved in type VI secretion
MAGQPAARVGDTHTCPMSDGPKPHVGGPILPAGCVTVLIGGTPAARITDLASCVGTAPDVITKGSPTVMIGNCGLSAARLSDSTVHGGLISKGEPTVLIGDSTTVFGPGPISPEQAQVVFDIMAAQGDIAFGYPIDGCYARAEMMAERMQQLGLVPSKAWTFARAGGVLTAKSPTFGDVTWGYHVATTLDVQSATGPTPMVFDPSLFSQPVSMAGWEGAQGTVGTAGITSLGQPPTTAGGSGYWPGKDPPGGIRKDAFNIMHKFLKLDPKKAACI